MTRKPSETTTQTREPRSIIEDYFVSLNAEKVDRLVDLFAEDGEIIAPLFKPIVGSAAIGEYYGRVYELYPRHRDTPTNVTIGGDRAAVEIEFEGTTSDGREIRFLAVDIFELRAARIHRLHTFFDSARLLRDLGKR